MYGIAIGAFIECSKFLQRLYFIRKSELIGILSEVHGMDQFGNLLLQFIFVVMQHIAKAAAGLYDCNHWSLIWVILNLISSTFFSRICLVDSFNNNHDFISGKSLKVCSLFTTWL